MTTITREEMAQILMAAVPDLPEASTIAGRGADGRLYVGGAWVEPITEDAAATARVEREATAKAWADMCRGITCISVLPTVYWVGQEERHGPGVRFDAPGSMHPLQQAQIIFVPESAAQRRETLAYLRRHAERVLIVQGG